MRTVVLALVFVLVAAGGASAEPARAEPRTVGALIEQAGVDRPWLARAVEVMPASVRDIDAAELSARVAEYIPAQMKDMPGMGGSKEDQEMRAMVIAMGAMSGYMLAAMPMSLSGVVWAAAGGYAAHYYYENFR